MIVMLGNLSADDIQARCGVHFPQDAIDFLECRRQEAASNIQPGKWHGFDIPFAMVFGDTATATTFYGLIAHLSPQFAETMMIVVEKREAPLT